MNAVAEVKIADFGLATLVNEEEEKTNKVATLGYRAPELLLGTTHYSSTIDMWSLGCCFAELHTGRPIFQGENEADQLRLIAELFEIYEPHIKFADAFLSLSKLPKLDRMARISKHIQM